MFGTLACFEDLSVYLNLYLYLYLRLYFYLVDLMQRFHKKKLEEKARASDAAISRKNWVEKARANSKYIYQVLFCLVSRTLCGHFPQMIHDVNQKILERSQYFSNK